MLREKGCELVEFSPLVEKKLPENIKGLIIGGGYPELYAEKLSANISMRKDIQSKIDAGMPTIAECGGFLYLHEILENPERMKIKMTNVIKAEAFKTDRLRRFGYITLKAEKNENF